MEGDTIRLIATTNHTTTVIASSAVATLAQSTGVYFSADFLFHGGVWILAAASSF